MVSVRDERVTRALAVLSNQFDPEIEQEFPTLEERILAQALENVERAERQLREIQELVGELALAAGR
jgi:hypothetical protein